MQGNDVHEDLYLNCEIHDTWDRGSGPRAGPIWSYSKNILNLKKSSLLPHMWEKLNVHEVLYITCDIHCSLVRGSGPRAGPYGHINVNAYNV